jgi:hypothetical protein
VERSILFSLRHERITMIRSVVVMPRPCRSQAPTQPCPRYLFAGSRHTNPARVEKKIMTWHTKAPTSEIRINTVYAGD